MLKDDSKNQWINSHLTWAEEKRIQLIDEWINGEKSSILSIRGVIETFDTQNDDIQSIKTSMPIYCIVLDNSPFKYKMSELTILWQNLFMAYLQQHCVNELSDIHEKLRSAEASLTPEPHDLHELKASTDLWQGLMDDKDVLFDRLEPLKEKLAELDSHAIQLKEEESKLRLTLMDSWKNYLNMLATIEKRNQRVRSNFQYETTKNLEEFLKETGDLKVQFTANAPFQSNYLN